MMEIRSTPVTMTEEEAYQKAMGRGSFFGRAVLGQKEIQMKKIFMENIVILFEIEYLQPPVQKWLKFKFQKPKQLVYVFFEGTRGVPSYMEELPPTVEYSLSSEEVQPTEFSEEEAIMRSRRMLQRMIRRRSGHHIQLEVKELSRLCRPYYFAFYGELVEGQKVRYLPMVADGYKISRSI